MGDTPLAALIEKLEATSEGSLELDKALCELVFSGVDWADNPFLVGVDMRFTRSLAAKLPGENIVEMAYYDGLYRVRHADGPWPYYGGKHKIEAIARRIAALKARS